MRITFDPAKDEWIRVERVLSLAQGEVVIRNRVSIALDARKDYGEIDMWLTAISKNGCTSACSRSAATHAT